MNVLHGREGQFNEYLQINLEKPKVKVIAQKSGDAGWYLYVDKGKTTITANTFFESSEDARLGVEVAAAAIEAFYKA